MICALARAPQRSAGRQLHFLTPSKVPHGIKKPLLLYEKCCLTRNGLRSNVNVIRRCYWFERSCRSNDVRAHELEEKFLHLKLDASRWQIGTALVAGGVATHVAPGVDGGVVHADFVMDVRTCRAATDAGVADHFAALYARAGNG
jgi:hypothetical protein